MKKVQSVLLAVAVTLGSCSACFANDVDRFHVEPKFKRTFSPQKNTPAGTVFHIRVLKKVEGNRFRLHLCGVPCNTAETVKVWEPESYKTGDTLSWRAEDTGRYYIWNEDPRTKRPVVVASSEAVGSRVRITFDSGAVIETWYVTP